ncbi:hypothetical protein BN946_scf184940.g106 [Trametes cinnabarina]|uniref:Ferritin-like domain-containing protein n=1 Tax=Pycnoporus cinnabarinus TaxID=5643 RepID=A0A060SIB0_PYCCI|nr:hypothetical protein BN946_scf184940.g106 [Trametes cinnabarina]
MFSKTSLLSLVAATAVFAAPTPVTDTDVLQFALTLENLENAFYSQGLAQYDAKAFTDAGFPDWVRGRFVQIGEHEAAHVQFLNGALGAAATKPCQYNFPHNSPATFAALSLALESVGDAAYLGAAGLLSDKGPWNGAFDAPLTPSGAFSLASLFVKSCPSSNPALPVTTFPALTISTGTPAPGATVSLKFTLPQGQAQPANTYVAWLNGLDVLYSDLAKDGTTSVPAGLAGVVFATLVSSKAAPNDTNMMTGFTIVQFPFDSFARSG